MKINKSSLKLVNVEYEEYIEWAINNHLKPYDKSTFELFFIPKFGFEFGLE